MEIEHTAQDKEIRRGLPEISVGSEGGPHSTCEAELRLRMNSWLKRGKARLSRSVLVGESGLSEVLGIHNSTACLGNCPQFTLSYMETFEIKSTSLFLPRMKYNLKTVHQCLRYVEVF